MTSLEDRTASLLQEINKDKSIESIFMSLDSEEGDSSLTRGSSGILSLDHILGGGYPYGRIIECFGIPQGGKSTLTLHAISEAQKRGNVACLIDAEFSFSMEYAKAVGVQKEGLIVSQPDYGEQALDSIVQLVKKLSPGDVIVVDSVAALVPKAELEGKIEDSHIGLQARMMSQALRTLTGEVSKSGVIIIFVNQIRQKIGGYGNPTDTPGGNALKFYSSIRLDVKSIGRIKSGEEAVGHKLQIETVKNKTYPPFKKAVTRLVYGKGVPKSYDVLSLAEQYKVVSKAGGGWYSYAGENIGQGFEKATEFLDTEPEVLASIEHDVLEKMGYKIT